MSSDLSPGDLLRGPAGGPVEPEPDGRQPVGQAPAGASPADAVAPLPWTGERFIPCEGGPEIYYEHAHRYLMARPVAAGRVVVDLASGEGYGAAWLAEVAHRVTGFDVDASTVEHARARYRHHANLEFAVADIQRVPLPDGVADVVTCFEAIEHVHEPELVVAEAARILRPGGVLLVSTPDKAVYSDARDYNNEFHLHELYRPELEALLAEHFPERTTLGQRLVAGSLTYPLDGSRLDGHDRATLLVAPGFDDGEAGPRALPDPLYVVVACRRPGGGDGAAGEVPLGAASVLVDPDELLLDRYRRSLEPAALERLLDHLRDQDEELDRARAQLAEDARTLARLERELRDSQPGGKPPVLAVAPPGSSREEIQKVLRRQQELVYRLSLDLDAANELNVRLLAELEVQRRAVVALQAPAGATDGSTVPAASRRRDLLARARSLASHPRVPAPARAVLRRVRRAVTR